jgi:hypothetical protein
MISFFMQRPFETDTANASAESPIPIRKISIVCIPDFEPTILGKEGLPVLVYRLSRCDGQNE